VGIETEGRLDRCVYVEVCVTHEVG